MYLHVENRLLENIRNYTKPFQSRLPNLINNMINHIFIAKQIVRDVIAIMKSSRLTRLALLAVDKVVRRVGLPYFLGSPQCSTKKDNYAWCFPNLLRKRINDGNNEKSYMLEFRVQDRSSLFMAFILESNNITWPRSEVLRIGRCCQNDRIKTLKSHIYIYIYY